MKGRVYLFKRYERLWHWLQALLVLGLLVTGFESHGLFGAAGFERAVLLHEAMGLCLVVLIAFTMFWHATTGEGRQFVPTRARFADQVRFYTSGIFRGERAGEVRSPESKFNPVQKAAYFSLLIAIFPLQVGAGLVYLAAPWWPDAVQRLGGLRAVALAHTAGAYAMACFLIVHLYMLSTDKGVGSHLRAMLTGWAED